MIPDSTACWSSKGEEHSNFERRKFRTFAACLCMFVALAESSRPDGGVCTLHTLCYNEIGQSKMICASPQLDHVGNLQFLSRPRSGWNDAAGGCNPRRRGAPGEQSTEQSQALEGIRLASRVDEPEFVPTLTSQEVVLQRRRPALKDAVSDELHDPRENMQIQCSLIASRLTSKCLAVAEHQRHLRGI